MKWSSEALQLMAFMISELSTMKYGYRDIVEGCYWMSIKNCAFPKPEESIDIIVDEVIRILKDEENEMD